MESDRLQKLMDLLKEQGIQVTNEQAEQLLRSGKSSDGSEGGNVKGQEAIPYQMIKGYKVFVQYEPISEEEMKMKKAMVARIVANAMIGFNK